VKLLRQICLGNYVPNFFYQNRSSFIEDTTKTFGVYVFFWHTVYLLVVDSDKERQSTSGSVANGAESGLKHVEHHIQCD